MLILRLTIALSLCATLAACTPAFTEQNSKTLAAQTRLTDSIDLQRGNQRLLSRQAQICLISDAGDTESGLNMLRTMQAALGGYFVAVGVENEPMDYLRALASTSCPGAAYLFYVHPVGATCQNQVDNCTSSSYSQFVITIINSGDRSLVDRVKFSIRKGFLPLDGDNQQRLQKAFEDLAIELTGSR